MALLIDGMVTHLPEIDERLTPGVLEVLTVEGSIESRDGRGGTARTRVVEQLGEVDAALADAAAWAESGGSDH